MKTVFVSSTFIDMQAERDMLAERVLPAINQEAKQYGESVAFCDLRWGIHTGGLDEEASGKKILNACLYEIDHCRPYMIVFLGERYGWRPGEDLLRHTAEGHHLALSDYNISATALEIEYGAFSDPARFSRTLFYFRAPSDDLPEAYREENAEAREKLQALKEKISALPGAHLFTYDIPRDKDPAIAYGALAERITADLCLLFSEEWKRIKGLSAIEKERLYALSYAETHAEHFYSRPTKLALCEYLLDHVPFFLLQGADGVGKTALLCKLISDRRRVGVHVLPVFCGLQSSGTDIFSVARYILAFLADECSKDFTARLPKRANAAEYQSLIREALTACASLPHKLEIFIDALGVADDCGISDLADMPFFSRDIPQNVSFVLSGPFPYMFSAEHHTYPLFLYPIQADAFDKEQINAHMIRGMGKELDDDVLAIIDQKSQNPLHLKWLLGRLSAMQRTDFEKIAARGGGMEAITAYQKEILAECPSDLSGMGMLLAHTACERIGGEAAKQILDYICASRDGLSEECLKRLFAQKGLLWSGIDFRLLIQFLDDFLFLRADGYYVLLHPYIKNALPTPTALYQELLDEIRSREEMSEREILDFVYYTVCANLPQEHLRLVLTHTSAWQSTARATFYALRLLLRQKSFHEKDRFLEEWMNESLAAIQSEQEKNTFLSYFENEYNEACSADIFYFRVMAHILYGDWKHVDAIARRSPKKEEKYCFTEEYELRFKELCRTFESEENQKAQELPPRRERIVAPEERKGALSVADRAFYLFAKESSVFLMRDDEVLLTVDGYGIQSYDLRYDAVTGALTFLHSCFDHHDGESLLTTYTFHDPLAKTVSPAIQREDKKGLYGLPIRL